MAVEYDLVIIGGTLEGYTAAHHAARLGARVALVLQGKSGRRSLLYRQAAFWALQAGADSLPPSALSADTWQWGRQRAALIAQTQTANDWQQLMVQGVDVVAEQGKIRRDRRLSVQTTHRRLTTRAILLATGSRPRSATIPGVDQVPYDTPDTFLKRGEWPRSVVIIGSAPLGLALGQGLSRWGVTVTVMTAQTTLLANEDPDISRWLTAQLRADDVRLHLGATVSAIAPEGAAVRLQLAAQALTAESLIVALPPIPDSAGIDWPQPQARGGWQVNCYLQTEQPRIYACGAAIGGDELPAIACQEARLAVENALFWNRQRIDYRCLPYDLPTQPPLARVGLTEPQARQRYPARALLIACQTLDPLPAAHYREATTGFCKLIAHRDGRLLGAHGAGPEATEWIQCLGLLMAANVPWWAIARYPTLPTSLTAILSQVTAPWLSDRWQPGRWRRDWAENWHNWRRSR